MCAVYGSLVLSSPLPPSLSPKISFPLKILLFRLSILCICFLTHYFSYRYVPLREGTGDSIYSGKTGNRLCSLRCTLLWEFGNFPFDASLAPPSDLDQPPEYQQICEGSESCYSLTSLVSWIPRASFFSDGLSVGLLQSGNEASPKSGPKSRNSEGYIFSLNESDLGACSDVTFVRMPPSSVVCLDTDILHREFLCLSGRELTRYSCTSIGASQSISGEMSSVLHSVEGFFSNTSSSVLR